MADTTHYLPQIRHKCTRFKDDCLLVMSPQKQPQLISHITVCSGYFKVEVENESTDTVSFLNLEVFKTAGGTRLSTLYHFKEGALAKPLSATSGQAMSCHKTWPTEMCRNIINLSTFESDARNSLMQLYRLFNSSLTPICWPKDPFGQEAESGKFRQHPVAPDALPPRAHTVHAAWAQKVHGRQNVVHNTFRRRRCHWHSRNRSPICVDQFRTEPWQQS